MSNIEINEAELKFIKCNISLLHWFLRAYISIVSSEDSSSCLVKNETRAGYFPLGFKPGVVHHAVAVRVCLLGFRQGVSRRIRTKVIPSTLYINILLLREIWFYLFYLFIYFYECEAEMKRPVKVGGERLSAESPGRDWLTSLAESNRTTTTTHTHTHTHLSTTFHPSHLPRLPPNMERLNRSQLDGGRDAARTLSWTWRTASPAADGRWEERWEGEETLIPERRREGGREEENKALAAGG